MLIAGVLRIPTSFVIISMREKKAKDAYNRRYETSIKDELTGLYNRRGFEVDCEIIKKNNNFDYLTENFQGNLISELSVSKGVVVCSEHIELNFEEIKAMADKLMYADKDEYYRRTGKDRRRV